MPIVVSLYTTAFNPFSAQPSVQLYQGSVLFGWALLKHRETRPEQQSRHFRILVSAGEDATLENCCGTFLGFFSPNRCFRLSRSSPFSFYMYISFINFIYSAHFFFPRLLGHMELCITFLEYVDIQPFLKLANERDAWQEYFEYSKSLNTTKMPKTPAKCAERS